MILIYPPVAKPCEPPAGLAKLSGALNQHKIRHEVLDANLEGLLYVMNSLRLQTISPADKWTARAFRNLFRNYALLKDW